MTTERPRSPEGGQAPPAGTWERGDDSGGLSEGAESRFSTDKSESEDNWSTSSNDSDEEAACHPSPGEIIGRGAFGSVYKTTWKGVPAALKVTLRPSPQPILPCSRIQLPMDQHRLALHHKDGMFKHARAGIWWNRLFRPPSSLYDVLQLSIGG